MKPENKDNYWQQDPDEEDAQPVVKVASKKSDKSDKEVPVHWSASEYIHFEKGGMWYVVFIIVALGLAALGYFVMHSITFAVLVIVMAIAVLVFARRPPRTIEYTLSGRHGLYVGERLYNLNDFKAFGLIRDGQHNSIMLIPIKRFSPGVSVYFPEEAGEEIVDILGSRLPMETLKLDMIDIVVRQLRL